MPFKIVRNDITKMNTEAIVNTANPNVDVGPGCDTAIYKAAGTEQLLTYRREHIGPMPEGEAFITPGFDLAAKYIIHTVSPLYHDGNQGEEERLRSCYRNSLRLASENHISSIAFPLISTGGYGYPKEEGMRIAVDEISAFLLRNDMMIYLVVFDSHATSLGEKITPDLERYIDQNYVENRRTEEYDEVLRGFSDRRRPDGLRRSIYREEPEESYNAAPSVNRKMRPQETGSQITGPQMNGSQAVGPKPSPSEKAKKKSLFDRLSLKAPAAPKAPKPQTFQKSYAEPERDLDLNLCCEAPADSYDDFITKHESSLEERMRHMSDTFSEYLMYLIQDKHMENADVWKRAIVDKKVFSKIKNNPDYHPQKRTALCLCIGAQLNLDETRDLLARAGYALSPCDRTDIIFSYFIENEIYDMIELDIELEEYGEPCIIA